MEIDVSTNFQGVPVYMYVLGVLFDSALSFQSKSYDLSRPPPLFRGLASEDDQMDKFAIRGFHYQKLYFHYNLTILGT